MLETGEFIEFFLDLVVVTLSLALLDKLWVSNCNSGFFLENNFVKDVLVVDAETFEENDVLVVTFFKVLKSTLDILVELESFECL